MTELERVAEQYADENFLVDEVPIPQVYAEAFKAGAEWQKKQLIDKACDWIKINYDRIYLCNILGSEAEYITNEFRKVMED